MPVTRPWLSAQWQWFTPRCSTRLIRSSSATDLQLPAERTTSEEAAAATAAAAVLATIDPKTASEMKVALASYLGSIPDGTAKLDGIKLGDVVAARILAAREKLQRTR